MENTPFQKMLSIDKQVSAAARKKKINELARSIRKKYLSFKQGDIETEENLKKIFKPMVTPLKEIASTSSSLSKSIKAAPVKVEVKKEEIKQQEDVVGQTSGTSPIPNIQGDYYTSDTSPIPNIQDDYYEDDVFHPDPFNISTEAFDEYIEQYHPMTQPYVLDFFQKSSKIDNVYGPIYDLSASKWILGNKVINFNKKNGYISVGDVEFKATPGLYQLLFYKDPSYNKEDEKKYLNLLDLTNVHRRSDKRLKSSRLSKYQDIIQPNFQVEARSRTKTSGHGLIYNEKPIEYVYWDNINELVDRLKLLVASKEAGNNSLDNEIIAIINELKEANIISD